MHFLKIDRVGNNNYLQFYIYAQIILGQIKHLSIKFQFRIWSVYYIYQEDHFPNGTSLDEVF